ncbi:MAG: GNAT family N-acetyltransferase [Dehalococcoidia bacterium]|nr:GNAT family N-acetyltransferase [Dehalococcoidia bacterium]
MAAVQVIDPRSNPAWDEFVSTHPEATVFHTAAWAAVLCETYGYRPRYYVLAEASGAIAAALPMMLVSSRLTGRRLVGLPFSDLCPPLALPGVDASALVGAVLRDAAAGRLSYVEVRGPSPLPLEEHGFKSAPWFLRYLVPLDAPLKELESRFHPSARRGIRKAEKELVRVRCTGSAEDLRRFYDLHLETRRGHGLMPQPRRFFQRIHEHYLATGEGFLLVAEADGRLIAGDLLLRHGRTLVYKFNASDERFLERRPNNALMWEAVQLGQRLGCTQLDLGRCETDNEGLRRFKALWASEEAVLPYYFYPEVKGATAMSQKRLANTLLAAAVRFTPRPLLPRLGSLTYRHLG